MQTATTESGEGWKFLGNSKGHRHAPFWPPQNHRIQGRQRKPLHADLRQDNSIQKHTQSVKQKHIQQKYSPPPKSSTTSLLISSKQAAKHADCCERKEGLTSACPAHLPTIRVTSHHGKSETSVKHQTKQVNAPTNDRSFEPKFCAEHQRGKNTAKAHEHMHNNTHCVCRFCGGVPTHGRRRAHRTSRLPHDGAQCRQRCIIVRYAILYSEPSGISAHTRLRSPHPMLASGAARANN